jgi:uncharacterized repeat protein (TIGR03803 family)
VRYNALREADMIARRPGPKAPPRSRRQGEHRWLEALEDRWLPSLSILASFAAPGGLNPDAGMARDSSGKLFGTAASGGTQGDGTVFELPAGSHTITTLATFNGANGSTPEGNLVEDTSGNLFGTTLSGGASGNGTAFEVQAGSNTITTLASFNGVDGANPLGGLALDHSGNLFGTTRSGGANGNGTVFEVLAGSNTITMLASFNGSNGSGPNGVIEDSQGNLLGTTASGTVFELPVGSNTIHALASLGAAVASGLVEDTSGNLYGTTLSGGGSNFGTVYELAAGSSTIETLASFGFQATGGYGTLAIDAQGNLFGTLSGAAPGQRGPILGAPSPGEVFEVPAGSNTLVKLGSFPPSNGNNPEPDGTLIEDGSGDLFGTSYFGGSSGSGTVFEVPSRMPATVSLAASINPSPLGAGVTLTATVRGAAPASPTPTGPVVFLDGKAVLGAVNLNSLSRGVAVFSTTSLSLGTHAITARYLGDTNHADSTSGVVRETISAPVTNANLAFLQQAYADLLHRELDPSGQANWMGLLDAGTPRSTIIYDIETSSSQEYQSDEVNQAYELLLHRAADPTGLRAGLFMIANFGLQAECASIAGSAEYQQNRGGGTIDGWLTAMYEDAFHRPVDPSGQSFFGQALASGALSFRQVADVIFTSPEYYQDLVDGYYSTFLRRAADPGGLAYWVSRQRAGHSPTEIIAGILGSSEYFNLA